MLVSRLIMRESPCPAIARRHNRGGRHAQPHHEVDPFRPKLLPNRCPLGAAAGLTADKCGHEGPTWYGVLVRDDNV
jgi:hypothetical protein